MPTVTELTARVLGIVQDQSFSGEVLGYLNRGLRSIAGAKGSDGKPLRLPSCDTSATLKTSTSKAFVAMPEDFHHTLYWVFSSKNNDRVPVISFTSLLRRYPAMSTANAGDIRAVATKGDNLYYQDVPTTQDTLTLHYYRLPELLTASGEPTELPTHLADELLVSYCCKEIYALIEEDVNGKKNQTMYWEARFSRAMEELRDHCDDHTEPDYIADDADSVYSLYDPTV